jgi:hypothetical protein
MSKIGDNSDHNIGPQDSIHSKSFAYRGPKRPLPREPRFGFDLDDGDSEYDDSDDDSDDVGDAANGLDVQRHAFDRPLRPKEQQTGEV